MKIGILTFHCAHNYGAVLQAYALQEKLKSMGHEVEFIDYRPDYLLLPYDIFRIKRLISRSVIRILKFTINEILVLTMRTRRYRAFDRFINAKLKLSKLSFNQPTTQIPHYDAYVLGSDQIWNSKITNGFDSVFWGFFDSENLVPKISYAASMESSTLCESDISHIKKGLSNFSSISVREKTLEKLLQPLSNRKISTVLDPTLLINKEDWAKIEIKPKIKGKYVLVYQVRENKETLRIANEIAKQIGGIVIKLTAWLYFRRNKKTYQCASPEEFVGWISNAECIITTSFHGTAFSIIYNKPFYSIYLNDGSDSRSESLLTMLGLRDRFISQKDTPSFSKIDYKEANKLLNSLKDNSELYLKTSLI